MISFLKDYVAYRRSQGNLPENEDSSDDDEEDEEEEEEEPDATCDNMSA
jgi:hypothetical protein